MDLKDIFGSKDEQDESLEYIEPKELTLEDVKDIFTKE